MLQGERVRLRALEPGDAEAIWEWHQDHEFHLLDGWIYPASRQQIADWVGAVSDSKFANAAFAIATETGSLIGYLRLKGASSEHRHAEFGIAIERNYWDQGYGTDATRTILRFAFTEMGLHRVALGVLDSNVRAQRAYEKCGFQVEGRAREATYRLGRWCDVIEMAILDREFLALDAASPASAVRQAAG